jgi:peptidoglycan/xylan/chitin deacetylase (PgdA/CDA1 family)
LNLRILHVLSQIEVTGAEIYATQLAHCQLAAGLQVWIMSDTLHTLTAAQYLPMPLHQRSFWRRLTNIYKVRQFIKTQKIDVVHAHSRAASWVGYFATLRTKVPLISTIHGRQKPSLSKKMWNMYGDRLLTVCENLRQQILTQLTLTSRHVRVIPNGLEFNFLPERRLSAAPMLTLAGRTTGPKGKITSDIILQILPSLLAEHSTLQVQLLGGALNNLSSTAQEQFAQLQQRYPQRLFHHGFVTNLADYLGQSSCVVAAGRVAIDALALGVPTVALGEALLIGLVDEANLVAAIDSNFGDIGITYQAVPIDVQKIKEAISAALLQKNVASQITQTIRSSYNLATVFHEIQSIYQGAILEKWHPRHIPILMYHKVLLAPEATKHKIFVTQQQFAQHMQFLAKQNFTPITFKDYFAFRDGKKNLENFPEKPIILTFDDAYINNLDNALPILKKYNFKAVLYALGDLQVQNNHWDVKYGEPAHQLMSPEQLKIMAASGIEIGAHSMTHANLVKLDHDACQREIVESKKNLEKLLGESVISFAYPYGNYNDSVKTLTQQAGFRCAVATDNGGLFLEDDLYAIFRVSIMPRDKYWQFWKKTRSWYRERYFKRRGH